MNMTADCDTDENFWTSIEIFLIIWTGFEQVLSFSGEGYPKSVSQLLMFVVYQSYRTALPRKPIEPDVEAQSMHSTRSWTSWISVNVGK